MVSEGRHFCGNGGAGENFLGSPSIKVVLPMEKVF